MKNTDLIAAVGGIEKARGIVAGAPSVATAYHAKRSEYIKDVHMSDFYQCLVVNYEYFDSEHGYFLENQDVDCSLVDFITLSDLRTAITERDRAVAVLLKSEQLEVLSMIDVSPNTVVSER